jgi:hypothetical protein
MDEAPADNPFSAMRSMTRRGFLAAGSAACASLAMAARPAWAVTRPNWIDQRQFGPFICQSTFSLDDDLDVLNELPSLEQELTRVLAIRPPRKPIYIHLLGNRLEQYDYVKLNHPGVPIRRALFVQRNGQAHVMAYRQHELDVDLRHECTHALLHSDLATVPLWLDEGIAEYFEVPQEQRAFDHPHFDSLRWNLRLGLMRPVATLEDRNDLADMSATDYRFSWAWVHFMLHGPKPAFDCLIGFLSDIRHNRPPGQFSERLEQAVPNATDQLAQHFKSWRK